MGVVNHRLMLIKVDVVNKFTLRYNKHSMLFTFLFLLSWFKESDVTAVA